MIKLLLLPGRSRVSFALCSGGGYVERGTGLNRQNETDKVKGKGGHRVLGLFVLTAFAESCVCCEGMFETFSPGKCATDGPGADGLSLASFRFHWWRHVTGFAGYIPAYASASRCSAVVRKAGIDYSG